MRGRIMAAAAAVAILLLTGCATGLPGAAAPDPTPTPFAPCHRKPEASAAPAAVAKTERIAMPEDRFWDLIDGLDHSTDEAPYRRLSMRLAGASSVDEVIAFDARLTLALYALDSACRAEWIEYHYPSGLGSVADDDFLYFRCDTVVAGRATWTTASTTQTLPWGRVDAADSDAEPLLYVGMDAAKRLGISNAQYFDLSESRIPISYETGSNPQGWPPAKDDGTLNRGDD